MSDYFLNILLIPAEATELPYCESTAATSPVPDGGAITFLLDATLANRSFVDGFIIYISNEPQSEPQECAYYTTTTKPQVAQAILRLTH
jgi:hypothetical protein